MKQMPELFDVQKTSLRHGSLMSTLSGSGSTLFSIAYKDDAQRIENELKKKFPHFKVLSCNFDNDGISLDS
jgi:homoserine kinase